MHIVPSMICATDQCSSTNTITHFNKIAITPIFLQSHVIYSRVLVLVCKTLDKRLVINITSIKIECKSEIQCIVVEYF